jgi:hypothetical protein
MESNIFKKIFQSEMVANGLSGKGSSYYSIHPDVVIVVGLQKSSYSGGFYINVGYLLPGLQGDCLDLKYADGSVRSRFASILDNDTVDLFDLGKYADDDTESLRQILLQNINKYVGSIKSLNDLQTFIINNPTLLYQTTVNAKEYLGFNP